MRIALYGIAGDKIQEHEERLWSSEYSSSDEIEITYFDDEIALKENLNNYEIVIMDESALKRFEEYFCKKSERKRITLTLGKEIGTFYVDDIYYIEAELSKVHMVTVSGEYLLPITITQMEEMLESEGFIKVHRSYLVNQSHVVKVKHRLALMDNGRSIPISKYRLKEVKEKISNSGGG